MTKTWRSHAMAGLTACMLAACGGGDDGGSMPPPGASYVATALITDTVLPAYGQTHTDSLLVNPWGIAFNPQGFVWVANNGSDSSTLYDGNGVPQSTIVTTPAAPTGIVFNPTTDFGIAQGAASGVPPFIFATEDGALAAWAPDVDAGAALQIFDGSSLGASYKGLALATQNGAGFLYAADFHGGVIDMFDGGYNLVAAPGGFADPNLPAGYAPFGIQTIGDEIFITYAQRAAQGDEEVTGAGLGIVDVFDTSGNLLQRLVTGGVLNAPWGIAKAPANFGDFSNALLVANFGDGTINAFDFETGAFLGTLSDPDGNFIVIDGLWGIAFGNGVNGQPSNTLFFTAGPNAETHGLYGRIDVQ
jgi:uncharacterized protein (TIGR03118 family)